MDGTGIRSFCMQAVGLEPWLLVISMGCHCTIIQLPRHCVGCEILFSYLLPYLRKKYRIIVMHNLASLNNHK